MNNLGKILSAVDLFSGAGGLSYGFEMAGFEIVFAVENDRWSAETYRMNRNNGIEKILLSDISVIDFKETLKRYSIKEGEIDILLCGAPCQGFSSSNKRTRNISNPHNGLYREFLRSVKEIQPKWILFENVVGITNYDRGSVIDIVTHELDQLGYSISSSVLNSVDFGIPQMRKRFFLIANRMGIDFIYPRPIYDGLKKPYITVRDALSDLPDLENGNMIDQLPYLKKNITNPYQNMMRQGWPYQYCDNNLLTRHSDLVIERYKHIPPGGNWEHIPSHLMANYRNKINCHSGIYKRLKWDEPSIVISNFRKSMLIHPGKHRGLSVREAARLQSFPDKYRFFGTINYQQQQVANAVPPLLAKAIADYLINKMESIYD